MTPSDTPAFPVPETVYDDKSFQPDYKGMTLRQYYAAKALQGLLTRPLTQGNYQIDQTVKLAFEYADLMLEAGKEK